jgi:hypothetical protein
MSFEKFKGTKHVAPTGGCGAIWDVELSADEIKKLSKGASPKSIQPDRLVFFWPIAYYGEYKGGPAEGGQGEP